MDENLLDNYPVVLEIPVAWGDMDAFNHVNNTVYLRYFESSRIAYFEKLKVFERMRESGLGAILASVYCRFRIPLTYPDKVLVGARATSIESDRFTLEHIVLSQRHDKLAAEGEGLIVAFDYNKNKKGLFPGDMIELIHDIEAR